MMNDESEKKRRTPRSRASRPPRVSARMTIVVIVVKSQPASAGSVGELREKISARVSAHHPRAERRATRAGDAAGESIDRSSKTRYQVRRSGRTPPRRSRRDAPRFERATGDASRASAVLRASRAAPRAPSRSRPAWVPRARVREDDEIPPVNNDSEVRQLYCSPRCSCQQSSFSATRANDGVGAEAVRPGRPAREAAAARGPAAARAAGQRERMGPVVAV